MLVVFAACAAELCCTASSHARSHERNELCGIRVRHPQDGPHVDLRFRVEPQEFVIEVAMNLTFLDWMLDAPREDPERVDTRELAALGPRFQSYFSQQMPVRVDGIVVPPVVRTLQVNNPDESLLPLFPLSGWKGLRKVFFNLAYPLKAPPDEISLAWPAYPPDVLSVLPQKPPLEIAAEWTADGLRSQVLFTRAEPGFTWRRPSGELSARLERVPLPPVAQPWIPVWMTMALMVFVVGFFAGFAVVLMLGRRFMLSAQRAALLVGLLCAAVVILVRPSRPAILALGSRATTGLDEREACEIFEKLQANLYRAFDYEAESTVYDALAQSVDGALLEETYLSVRRALVLEEEGGAMSRVVAVRPVRTRLISQGEIEDGATRVRAFSVEATWQVDGRVTHWGHMHDRTNEYDGRFTVAATKEGWRVHDAEVTRQERVDGTQSVEGAKPTVPAENEEL